jgi:hypothetical protein
MPLVRPNYLTLGSSQEVYPSDAILFETTPFRDEEQCISLGEGDEI